MPDPKKSPEKQSRSKKVLVKVPKNVRKKMDLKEADDSGITHKSEDIDDPLPLEDTTEDTSGTYSVMWKSYRSDESSLSDNNNLPDLDEPRSGGALSKKSYTEEMNLLLRRKDSFDKALVDKSKPTGKSRSKPSKYQATVIEKSSDKKSGQPVFDRIKNPKRVVNKTKNSTNNRSEMDQTTTNRTGRPRSK